MPSGKAGAAGGSQSASSRVAATVEHALGVSLCLCVSVVCSLVFSLCLSGLADAQTPAVADRAAAAAAGGARDQVPALRDPDAAERPAGRGGAASRAAGGDDAAAGAQRHGVGSEGQARARAPGGVAARPGHDDEVGRADERRRRLHRRRDGRRRRHRPDLREHGGDEGQLRRRDAHAVRDGAAAGVRAGRDRAAAAADAVGPAGQPRGSRSTSPTPCSIGSSTDSIRTACRPTARRRRLPGFTRDDLVAFHTRYFVPNNAILAIVGDVTADEAFAAAKKVFGDWAKRDLPPQTFIDPPEPTRRVIVVNKPDAVQTEIRVGHLGIPRQHPDYMAVNLAIRILGGEGQQPPAPGAADRARADLRRAGQHGHAEADGRLRGRDQHADRRDRRSAAADRRRVLAAAARTRRRARARRRQGVSHRQLSADHRDAGVDRDAGASTRCSTGCRSSSCRRSASASTPSRWTTSSASPATCCGPIACRSSSSATRRRSRRSFAASASARSRRWSSRDLDLTSANFKKGQIRRPAGWPARSAVGRVGRVGLVGVERGGFSDVRSAAYQQAPAASRPAQEPRPEEGARAVALLDRAIAAKGGLEKLRALKTIVARQTQAEPAAGRRRRRSRPPTTFSIRIASASRRRRARAGVRRQPIWMQDRRGVHDAAEAAGARSRAPASAATSSRCCSRRRTAR